MELTQQQQEQLKKVSKLERVSDVVLLQSIDEVKREISDKIENVTQETNTKLKELSNQIASIEIPEQKDHTEHMKMMMNKIEEPMDIQVTLNII